MSKKPDFSSFTALNLNPKVAKQLAEINKIIRKVSDKEKHKLIEKGLSVKPLKEDVITAVDINKIVHSAFFIRSKVCETFDDLETITKPDPIKVVVTEDKERHFLIDGQRRLAHAKRNGEKQVEVQIIGTVVCQSQIGMARGKEMVKFKKPLTPLELANGLLQLRDQIIRDFGEGAFFSHGGDRKTANGAQQSLPEYIATALGINKSKVDTLLRFGSNVGPMGLAGLLTKDDMVGMPLRQINQINASLKNADLPKQIAGRAEELIKAGATRNAIIEEAGNVAKKTVDEIINNPRNEDNDNNDDDNEGTTETKDIPPPSQNGLRGKNNDSDDGDDSDDFKDNKRTRKTIQPSKIVKIISEMEIALKKLKSDFKDCKRIDDIDQAVVEAKWKKLENFWGELCLRLGQAGLS